MMLFLWRSVCNLKFVTSSWSIFVGLGEVGIHYQNVCKSSQKAYRNEWYTNDTNVVTVLLIAITMWFTAMLSSWLHMSLWFHMEECSVPGIKAMYLFWVWTICFVCFPPILSMHFNVYHLITYIFTIMMKGISG